jgi:hypothetical protein
MAVRIEELLAPLEQPNSKSKEPKKELSCSSGFSLTTVFEIHSVIEYNGKKTFC